MGKGVLAENKSMVARIDRFVHSMKKLRGPKREKMITYAIIAATISHI